jgi:hypothetical protein
LIQLLKSISIKSFVSTEAAHSTAAFQSVKLFLKNFSFLLNRLRFRHRFRSRLREAHSTAFKSAVNHLLSSAFDSGESKHRQSQTTTLPARRILIEFAADAIFYFIQLFDFQGVFRENCTGRGAHYKDPERAVKPIPRTFTQP